MEKIADWVDEEDRNPNKDADGHLPYGHHRYETAASLVLGLLLPAVTKRAMPHLDPWRRPDRDHDLVTAGASA